MWATEPIRAATDLGRAGGAARAAGAPRTAGARRSARAPTRFIGRIGDDGAGARSSRRPRDRGRRARAARGARARSCSIVAPDGERTMFPDRAAAAELERVDPGGSTASPRSTCRATGSSTSPCAVRCAGSWRRRASAARRSIDASSTGLLDGSGSSAPSGGSRRSGPTCCSRTRRSRAARRRDGGGRGIRRRAVVKHGPEPTEVFDDGVIAAASRSRRSHGARPDRGGRRVRGRIPRGGAAGGEDVAACCPRGASCSRRPSSRHPGGDVNHG